ncbi:hypothetical protein NESM_000862600 [Novymonas esmeraldas]|uniref:Uncharacterized protein n=1 Tax=Novymonas esmeraldas TaxID=1808958 RepID=A0AAW0EZK2_9TRYP
MADHGDALVVWGSTGRRLQFSIQDLKMPDDLRTDPHFHFYERQWDSVANFWFTRVLKEAALQHLAVEEIVTRIRDDIAKRWERRRQEQGIHKKRKRLLQGNSPAGAPTASVLVTNVMPLAVYCAATEAEQRDLVTAVVERVEAVAKDTVASWRLLVDDAAEEPPAKTVRGDGATAAAAQPSPREGVDGPTAEANFDDRVALVLTLSSAERAATAIVHLHGSRLDGRQVLCRFLHEP